MVSPVQSLTDRVSNLHFDDYILLTGFFGEDAFFVLSNGTIQIGRERAAQHPHQEGVLVAKASASALFTGGEDGKVILTTANGDTKEIADEKGKWIDALTLGSEGAVAWSTGKTVRARDKKGMVKTFIAPSTARGLAFAPKGYRLAVAHIDGASLWFPNLPAAPEVLSWKGSHLDVTHSLDGRFIVTSMQENQLHGWKMADKAHMRMSGYPGKVRDFSWSHDGFWLATSGAEAAIIWPFAKDGPMGKAPRECGTRPARVSRVAFHPKALVLAIGYQDGWVLLCRLTDGAEILIRAGGDNSAITALGWNAAGTALAFGAESGAAGIVTLPM